MKKNKYHPGYPMLIFWESARLTADSPQYRWALEHRLCDGFEWRYPLQAWQIEMVEKHGLALQYAIPSNAAGWAPQRQWVREYVADPEGFFRAHATESPDVLDYALREVHFPVALVDEAEIDRELDFLRKATRKWGKRAWWSAEGEWDSSGFGFMPMVDPEIDAGKHLIRCRNRHEGYMAFRRYMESMEPIRSILADPKRRQHLNIKCAVGYAMSTHYAMEFGFDQVLLERHNDAIGDLQTGLCYIRGAARQYGKMWGIDMSKYRRCCQGSTAYDSTRKLKEGFSAYFTRCHYYLTYMSGAHSLKQEQALIGAATGECFLGQVQPDGTVMPTATGMVVLEFADFVRNRYPERGRVVAPVALLFDHEHGYSPEGKYYRFTAPDTSWWCVPFEAEEYQMAALFRFFFPAYEAMDDDSDAPWRDPALSWRDNYACPEAQARRFREFLAAGGDPRAFETLSPTPFGNCVDVLLSNVEEDALSSYRVIIAGGKLRITPKLRGALLDWVAQGGTLIGSRKHLRGFGFRPGVHRHGQGEIVVAAESEILDAQRRELVPEYRRLIAERVAKHLPLVSRSEALHYVVHEVDANTLVVGCFNHTAAAIPVCFATERTVRAIRDVRSGEEVEFQLTAEGFEVKENLPPFDLRMLKISWGGKR